MDRRELAKDTDLEVFPGIGGDPGGNPGPLGRMPLGRMYQERYFWGDVGGESNEESSGPG